MILAFSTSSPWASVAAIAADGKILWSGQEFAPRNAGAACLALLDQMKREANLTPADADFFGSDIGPGSFTGVRVGVIMAKTFGFLMGKPVSGANAFDLVSPSQIVALPSKKGEFFVRLVGEEPVRGLPVPEGALGYGFEPSTPPTARGFALLLDRLVEHPADRFLPEYLIEPSISIPNKPFAGGISG